MKKLFVYLCISVLSLSIIPDAFAQYDNEITFRDIPWGTSFDKIPSYLSNNIKEEANCDQIEDIILFGNRAFRIFENDGLGKKMISNYPDNEGIEVGEYKATSWSLYFAYIPKNDKLTYNNEDTQLYAAQYTISPMTYDGKWRDEEQKERVINSYISKLTLLYGNPEKKGNIVYESFFKNKKPIDGLLWNGENNTVVVLSYYHDYSSSDLIHITYAWLEGDNLLQIADELTDATSLTYKRLFLGCDGL